MRTKYCTAVYAGISAFALILLPAVAAPITEREKHARINARTSAPENDDPSVLDRTADPFDLWSPLRSEGTA